MSIKNNTISLQEILETINTLPEAGGDGIKLPTLTNPATEDEVFLNKQIINADGNVRIGGFTIDSELNAQDDLITQIQGALQNKTAGKTVVDDVSKAIIDRTITGISDDNMETIGRWAFAECSSLTTVSFPACTSIGGYAFSRCVALTSVSFPVCTSIGGYAFANCNALTTVSFPMCMSISGYAFQYCAVLNSVSFPVCTSIGSGAFQNCSFLTSVSFPTCTTIGNNAFNSCPRLTTASFPVCTSISNNAFRYCSALTTVSFPTCTNIGDNAFMRCNSLTTVSFPMCMSIDYGAFSTCFKLRTVSFPACTTIDSWAFAYCSSLAIASFPVCTNIGDSAFYDCSSLTIASFPACVMIGNVAFHRCYKLSAVHLEAPSVCTLSNSNAFSLTPFAGYSSYFSGTPYIYVRASLVDAYKSATNWVYFSNYISAIEGSDMWDDGVAEDITFTIDGVLYQAEPEMTWEEWIYSDYNIDNFQEMGDYIMTSDWMDCVYSSANNRVKIIDLIVNKEKYHTA